MSLRIAFLGVSHWHAPIYYRPAVRLPGVRVVGVSDPSRKVAEAVGSELEAPAFSEVPALLSAARPDFVFVFGRHCDMTATADLLIDAGLPFLLEKPGGLTAARVAALRERVQAKGLHVGTGFNYRVSEMYARILAVIGTDAVTHAAFRFIAGGPSRYREGGCAWMLDPALSGGGPTINLAPHFMDMFRTFTRSAPHEVVALMGHHTYELPIEDYSAVLLRSERAVCTIETGYTYPAAQSGVFDLRFSLRTSRHYIVVRSDNVIEIHRSSDGHREEILTPTSNIVWYPLFVTETLKRFVEGRPPVADLNALVAAMEIVDAAYDSDRAGGSKVTPERH